jgi:hypothetical protein
MDGPSLLPLMIIVGAFLFAAPRVASAVGSTSDLLAQLFVPPDRALPWPHGVQESDEPWAWRSGPASGRPEPPDAGDRDDGPTFDIVDFPAPTGPARGGLVVDLRRVPPNRPHRAAA